MPGNHPATGFCLDSSSIPMKSHPPWVFANAATDLASVAAVGASFLYSTYHPSDTVLSLARSPGSNLSIALSKGSNRCDISDFELFRPTDYTRKRNDRPDFRLGFVR